MVGSSGWILTHGRVAICATGGARRPFRVSTPLSAHSSFWVRIPGQQTNTRNHTSGWISFYGIQIGYTWHWDEVHSHDDDDRVVEFTLSAGTHTLEIARQESGVLLDTIAVLQ